MMTLVTPALGPQVISQSMEATSLADLINGIVSDIDQDVVGRRMTKVDTIGDGKTIEL